MKPQIVNIINFIRGVEPRDQQIDLFAATAAQVRLLKQYDLPGTFLIQYDALLKQEYIDLLKQEAGNKCEIGVWLEIVQPLAEKAGLEWRGRPGFPWDWHANVGFTVGYTLKERERLVDVLMDDFKTIFGYYPLSVGSWLIDAYTLRYLHEKYGIIASCNCKDQWGTDGYTMWGGYYNQAYYPSRSNVFTPAQSEGMQIPVPIFRMLGSDPIYQYDAGLLDAEEMNSSECQPVVTLEPVYSKGGGDASWVQWYFNENFNGKCLSFGYTQVGQENSFGWEAMKEGLSCQIALVAEKASKEEIRVETLHDSAKWFRENYPVTPSASIVALSDWKGQEHKSVWYYNRFYRVNLYIEADQFWIRDIYLFDEAYAERYLDDICEKEYLVYDNLPVLDGNKWSGGSTRAGIRPVELLDDGTIKELTADNFEVSEIEDRELLVSCRLADGSRLKLLFGTDKIRMEMVENINNTKWAMKMEWNINADVPIRKVEEKVVYYQQNDFFYSVQAEQGIFAGCLDKSEILFIPDHDVITLNTLNSSFDRTSSKFST